MPFIVPIIAAIATAATAIGTFVAGLGIVGSSLVVGGIGIAASYLIQTLSPKPKNSEVPSGVNFEKQYGSSVPRQVASGLVGIAGHDTHINTYGPANKFLQQIYTVSDYYCTALNRIWINGKLATLDTTLGPKGYMVTSGDYATFIYIKFLDGRQTAADSDLVTWANPTQRWPNTSVGLGIAAVVVTMVFDKDKNNSFPDFFFELKGAPYYDWRKDTTVGGSGAHRFNDVTTHEYTANPIIIEYNYRRGLKVNGDLFCGMDMSASDLPLAKWTLAANICDEAFPGDGLPRYQCGVMLNCMSTHSDNIQALAACSGAMQIDAVDGSWPLVGTNQAVVATFTDADIITAADFKFTAKRSMGELVNAVTGNYPAPDQQWSMIGYKPQVSTTYQTIDRRSREIPIDFPSVSSARQAAQLASIILYENRYEAKATVTLRPRFQVLEAGDWVRWNSARYGDFTYIVTSRSLSSLESDTPRNVLLGLQQRDGAIYSGITPPTTVYPYPAGQPSYASETVSFAVIPVSVTASSGQIVPALRASWNAFDDVTVIGVDVAYWPTLQPTSVIHKVVDADQIVVILAEGIVGATEYTIKTKLITRPARTTVYNAGVTATTSSAALALGAEIIYQITALENLNAQRLKEFENTLAALLSQAAAQGFDDQKIIRKEVSVRTDKAFAGISEARTVAVGAVASLADFTTVVNARFANAETSITVSQSSIALLNGYAASQYAVKLDTNGYGIGFQLFNGGPSTSAAVWTVDKFQIAFPGVAGGAAVPVFTIGNVSGAAKIGFRGDMFIDGIITARFIGAGEITAAKMAADSITAGNAAIQNLSIQSLKLGDNAVTVTTFQVYGGPSGSLGSAVDVCIANFSVNTTGLAGKTISVLVSFLFEMDRATGFAYTTRLFYEIPGGARTTVRTYATSGGPTGVYPFPYTYIHNFVASGGVDSFNYGINCGPTASSQIQNCAVTALVAKR